MNMCVCGGRNVEAGSVINKLILRDVCGHISQ